MIRPSDFVRSFMAPDDPIRIEFEASVVRIQGGDGEYNHPFCGERSILRESGWESPTRYWARETTITCDDHRRYGGGYYPL